MAQFPKLKILFTLKFNFNGGQFTKEISIFGYLKKWKQVRTRQNKPKKKEILAQ